jgi:hypothetical protein
VNVAFADATAAVPVAFNCVVLLKAFVEVVTAVPSLMLEVVRGFVVMEVVRGLVEVVVSGFVVVMRMAGKVRDLLVVRSVGFIVVRSVGFIVVVLTLSIVMED